MSLFNVKLNGKLVTDYDKDRPNIEVTINKDEMGIHEENGLSIFTLWFDSGSIQMVLYNELWKNIEMLREETTHQNSPGIHVGSTYYKIVPKSYE